MIYGKYSSLPECQSTGFEPNLRSRPFLVWPHVREMCRFPFAAIYNIGHNGPKA
jgi:hypothetical protein